MRGRDIALVVVRMAPIASAVQPLWVDRSLDSWVAVPCGLLVDVNHDDGFLGLDSRRNSGPGGLANQAGSGRDDRAWPRCTKTAGHTSRALREGRDLPRGVRADEARPAGLSGRSSD